MYWTIEFEVLPEDWERPVRPRDRKSGAAEGPLVAVIWSRPDEQSDWDGGVPGEVQEIPASLIALRPEYAELAALGDRKIPTIVLNEEYPHLKKYLAGRVHELSEAGIQGARNRYAVGLGVGLLLLDQQTERRMKHGEKIDTETVHAARQAMARGVLSIMPEFDELAKEAGLTDYVPEAAASAALAETAAESAD